MDRDDHKSSDLPSLPAHHVDVEQPQLLTEPLVSINAAGAALRQPENLENLGLDRVDANGTQNDLEGSNDTTDPANPALISSLGKQPWTRQAKCLTSRETATGTAGPHGTAGGDIPRHSCVQSRRSPCMIQSWRWTVTLTKQR
eukprot:SAG31_NODE_4411_length_3255_cov_1.311787_3_plen_143_part_00